MTTDRKAFEDFDRAVFKAFWRKISSRLTGVKNELLPFDEVRARLPIRGQRYLGLQQVPMDRIVGSVGRYRDFDRAFLPIQTVTKSRWVNISKARSSEVPLPPVDLYQIGSIFFVKDGNHRVSVAREQGQEFIDANVTEVAVPVAVDSEMDLEDLSLAQARSRFLEASQIERIRPAARIEASVAAHYQKLAAHLAAHRWYMAEKRGAAVSKDEAVASWYDDIYRPLVEMLREQGVLRSGSGRFEADFYIWIVQYQEYLREATTEEGDEARKIAQRRLLEENPGGPVRKLARLLTHSNRLIGHLIVGEYARFLEQTGLHRLRPEADLRSTSPHCYALLLEHVTTHRWYLGQERGRKITFEEATVSWYDTVYMPLVEIIRDQDILAHFPDRTETDLYLWIIERQGFLRDSQGLELSLEETAEQVVAEEQRDERPVDKVMRALKGGRKAKR